MARKRSFSSTAGEQETPGAPEAAGGARGRKTTSRGAAGNGTSDGTRASSRKGRKATVTATVEPARIESAPVEPAPATEPVATVELRAVAETPTAVLQQLQALFETARQSQDQLRGVGEAMQRLSLACSELASSFGEHLARHETEMSSIRDELRASAASMRDLIGEVRWLEEKILEDGAASLEEPPAADGPTEVAPALATDTAPGEHGWLGVTVEPAVLVAEVVPGSPAEAAGLAHGDVITGVNGLRILDAGGLKKLIDQAAGEAVTVQLGRGEQLRVVHVQLATPAPALAPDLE